MATQTQTATLPTLPKSCLAALAKGGRATFARADDNSYLCDSPTGNKHALRGSCAVPSPACDCKGQEIHTHCSHDSLLTALCAMCEPGETLRRGECDICPACEGVRLYATCTPDGTEGRIGRLRCECLRGIVRVR